MLRVIQLATEILGRLMLNALERRHDVRSLDHLFHEAVVS